MLVLFTDYGVMGPYNGQVKAVLACNVPHVPLVELMVDAPRFNPRASAYLLAALSEELPEGTICVGVVDPGVGTASREGVIVKADNRWFVGPANGLFEIVVQRATRHEQWVITWQPERLSASFHGRDLFAPIAARLVLGEAPAAMARPAKWVGQAWPDDLAEVIYLDSFGNVMTGLRGAGISAEAMLRVGSEFIRNARTFGEVKRGQLFWYVNSNGLIEVAANQADAGRLLGLQVGDAVEMLAL